MTTVAVSPRQLLKDFLLADSNVTALIGNRIYIGDLPKSVQRAGERVAPSIVLRGLGGVNKITMSPYAEGRVDLYTYGPTYEEAESLGLVVYNAIETGMPSAAPSGESFDFQHTSGARAQFRSYLVEYRDIVRRP